MALCVRSSSVTQRMARVLPLSVDLEGSPPEKKPFYRGNGIELAGSRPRRNVVYGNDHTLDAVQRMVT